MIDFKQLLIENRNKTLKYKIKDIDIMHIPQHLRLSYVENYFDPPIDLAKVHYEHYNKNDIESWREFIKNYINIFTNVIIIYTDNKQMPHLFSNVKVEKEIYICGVLSLIRRPLLRELYGRLLCSNCYCGGKLVRYTINTYKNSPTYYWISLHTLPTLIDYYGKYGWLYTKYYYEDGTGHPFMIYPTSPEYTMKYHHIYKLILYILLNLVCPKETLMKIPEIKGYMEHRKGEYF
jgi:hypothetical protein